MGGAPESLVISAGPAVFVPIVIKNSVPIPLLWAGVSMCSDAAAVACWWGGYSLYLCKEADVVYRHT